MEVTRGVRVGANVKAADRVTVALVAGGGVTTRCLWKPDRPVALAATAWCPPRKCASTRAMGMAGSVRQLGIRMPWGRYITVTVTGTVALAVRAAAYAGVSTTARVALVEGVTVARTVPKATVMSAAPLKPRPVRVRARPPA
jgi:hypothetical protein